MHGGGGYDGDEWEEYVLALLRLRYPPGELVEIPAKDRGDAGLEAYTHDGCAYQCYAPEEPISVDARYVKYRDKMTQDINKFKNAERIAPLLGQTKIKRWLLVVPTHDSKRIVERAQRKAKEVLDEGLGYVDPDFEVVVITAATFQVEQERLALAGLASVSLATDEPADHQVKALADAGGEHMENLDRKLAKVPQLSEPAARARYINNLLRSYLRGEDALAQLRDDYPELARPVEELLVDTERELVLRHAVATQPAGDTLQAVVGSVAEGVRGYIPGLRKGNVSDVAYAATSRWLMECPLDFPEPT